MMRKHEKSYGNWKKNCIKTILIATIGLLLISTLLPVSTSAKLQPYFTITGCVREGEDIGDPNKPVSDATVTATNLRTGKTLTTKSRSDGYYSFTYVYGGTGDDGCLEGDNIELKAVKDNKQGSRTIIAGGTSRQVFIGIVEQPLIPPGFYSPIALMVYVIIIGTIIVTTTSVVVVLKRKKKGKIKRVSLEEVGPINVQCPHCQTTFQITPTKKPFKVKCPKCGKVSMLR